MGGFASKQTHTQAQGTTTSAVQHSPGKSTLVEHAYGPEEAVQRKAEIDSKDVHATAEAGASGPGGKLPFLDLIQRSFGSHDVSEVRAHTDGAAAAANAQMGSRAYARGNDIAFGGAPDLHTVAHEAAHVIQQRGGVQLKSGVGETGDTYEQHADQVADAVVRGQSAECLLDRYTDQHASAHARGGGSGTADGAHKRDASADVGGPTTTAPVQRFTDDSQMMLVSLFALLVRLIWHVLAGREAPQQGDGVPTPMAPADRPTPEPDGAQVESIAGELSDRPALRDKVQTARHDSGAPDEERIVRTLAGDAEVEDTIAKALRDKGKEPKRMDPDRTAEHVGERLGPSHSPSTAPGWENQGTRDEAGSSFDHALHGPVRTSGVAGEQLEPSTEIASGPVESFGELLKRCEVLCNTIRAHGYRPIPYGLDEQRVMLISETRSRGLVNLAGLLETLGLRKLLAYEDVLHADLFDDQACMAAQPSTSTSTAGEPSTVREPDALTRGAPQSEPGPSSPRSAKGREKVTEDDEEAARPHRNALIVRKEINHHIQDFKILLSTIDKTQREHILNFIKKLDRASVKLNGGVKDDRVESLKEEVRNRVDSFRKEISTAQTDRPTESGEFRRTVAQDALVEWIREHAASGTADSALTRCAKGLTDHDGKGATKFTYDDRTVFHVSAGNRAKSNGCTVFFVVTEHDTIIIIGVGRHLGSTSYKLNWRHPAWKVTDRLAL